MTMATEWIAEGSISFPGSEGDVCRTISWFVIRRHALFFFSYFFFYYFLALTITIVECKQFQDSSERFLWAMTLVFFQSTRDVIPCRCVLFTARQSRVDSCGGNTCVYKYYVYIYIQECDILSNGMMRWSETLDYWSLCVFSYVRNTYDSQTRTLRLYHSYIHEFFHRNDYVPGIFFFFFIYYYYYYFWYILSVKQQIFHSIEFSFISLNSIF